MLVIDDNQNSWPRYYLNTIGESQGWVGLVYRYDHPDQPGPWLRWLSGTDAWTAGQGKYEVMGRYTDRQDFQRATAKELVDKYKMSPERLFTPLPEWTAAQPFPGEVTCAGD